MQPGPDGMTAYVVFLVIGVAVVFMDGWLIRRSGETYLEEVYPDPRVAESVNRLITVLFHLAVLGVLALISTVDITGRNSVETVVARLGVMLLVMAVAHGITMWVFARMRTRHGELLLHSELAARSKARYGYGYGYDGDEQSTRVPPELPHPERGP